MKETIKKSFVWWIVFLLTVFSWTFVYAAIVWTVSSGDTLTADMWNSMAWNYDYSTSEVDTWKKWLNGKPIYRKVTPVQEEDIADPWEAWILTKHWVADSPHVIIDHNLVLDWAWYSLNTSYSRPSAWWAIESYITKWWNLYTNNSWTNDWDTQSLENSFVIVYYTKTTD